MKKGYFSKKFPLFLTVFVDIILVFTTLILMNYAQQLLNSDIRTTLIEIVDQNKNAINNKLNAELESLVLVSNQLSDRYSLERDSKSLETIFYDFTSEKGDLQLFLGLPSGEGILPSGQIVNIYGRNYFRLALQGEKNISERLLSRFDGNPLFVVSVPIYSENNIIGTIQKQYTLEQMYEICAVSLYANQGYTYIINSEGYIILSSQPEVYNRESDNYFRLLYLDNPTASTKLENDIHNNNNGFMEAKVDNVDVFSAYTRLGDVYDWYLISSVQKNAVLSNVQLVVKIFYIVLLAVAFIFLLTSLYFLYTKAVQQKKLQKIAFIDPVTGYDTFAKFNVEIQSLFEKFPDKDFYIFTFDIDNFKYINNYYGIQIGDQILKNIHQIYSNQLGPHELCARIYSDHFVLLLDDVSKERLKKLFSSELVIDNITLYLSAGLYKINKRDENVSLMIDKANMAAKDAKGKHYKDVQQYDQKLDEQLIKNEQTKRAIEQAIHNDEIVPFFQPKINIFTGELEGAEALARWITKEGKIIPPIDFIPLSEKTGLIKEIDMLIFEKTLRFIKSQLDSGIECKPISINFSRIHLISFDFVSSIIEKLTAYQVPPNLIEIELTETAIFDSFQTIQDFINQLHENNLKISMDDFGSGYSSLNMLKEIDIDVIKFDQGFLEETEKDERQRIIFGAISQMAKKLNIRVVVEGVETESNLNLMRQYGVEIAQGYYFAKPMDIEHFTSIYKEGKL